MLASSCSKVLPSGALEPLVVILQDDDSDMRHLAFVAIEQLLGQGIFLDPQGS